MEQLQTAAASLEIIPVETPQQAETLAGLAREIWHECYREIITPQQIDYMLERYLSPVAIAAQAEREGYLFYLLAAEGESGGFLALQPEDGRLLLSKLYLHRRLRGQGHAKTALAFAEDTARRLACHTIWLTVNKQNARACAAYEKAGYTRTRTQTADIGGGYVMDDYIYEKPVAPA